jgi:hypothetical protein
MKLWLVLPLCLLAVPVAAELELQGVRWELVRRDNPRKPPLITPVQELVLAAGKTVKGRLMANLQFLNRGPGEDGVLIRYSLRAKLAPPEHNEAAAWSVPFMIEEKRIPKVAANQKAETALDPTTVLNLYLKKIERAGYKPQELKLEASVCPKRGDTFPIKVLEASLPVKR